MKIVVVADTFLKFLPDPMSQIRESKLSNQVVLLKKGTELEIYDYYRLESSTSNKVDDYLFIRLATPSKLTNHQNLCWFVQTAHVEIADGELHSVSPQERLHHRATKISMRPNSAKRELELANPMDSFGGLVVSPPVTAFGQYYPFGRIVHNSCVSANQTRQSLQTTSEVSEFLKAQKVQSPFGLHTDWLIVDRADEIVSFLPANNEKGFQVLVASPLSAKIILQGLANSGFADTVMFQGMTRADYSNPPGACQRAEISIGELLQDTAFWAANERYQSYMNDNIQTLRAELDINDDHLSNIPVLFHPPFKSGRTASYFPNMLNHCLLEKGDLLAPQPNGPSINGKCAFETALEYAISSRKIVFAKAWHVQNKW